MRRRAAAAIVTLLVVNHIARGQATITALDPGFRVGEGGASVSADGTIVVGAYLDDASVWHTSSGLQVLTEDGRSNCTGTSRDGSVHVGNAVWGDVGFVWTQASGLTLLPPGPYPYGTRRAYGVSGDGRVVVGHISSVQFTKAARWVDGTLELLGSISDSSYPSYAHAASVDGTVVVGCSPDQQNVARAYRWTADTGLQQLPNYGSGPSCAVAVSDDGSVIVGRSNDLPVRWAGGGIQALAPADITSGTSVSVSSDGSVIVGTFRTASSDLRGFVWTSDRGFLDLADWLVEHGASLPGWSSLLPSAISADGTSIAGIATVDGQYRSFLATGLDFSIPDCNGDGVDDIAQCRDGSLPDYNGNNIPDCCEQGVPCEVGNYPVQWRVDDGGNGHWYSVYLTPRLLSWSTARVIALSNGGDLASLETPAEQAYCFELFSPQSIPDAWRPQGPVNSNALMGPWLGAAQDVDGEEPLGGWRWLSGPTLSPTGIYCCNDECGNSDEDRLHLFQYANGDVGWNDLSDDPSPCVADDALISLLVEWSADCNGDGIVDYGQILLGDLVDANANGVPDTCECDADINDDGVVNGADISVLLGYWGQSGKNVVGDITGDSIVNGADLAQLLGSWGPCQ